MTTSRAPASAQKVMTPIGAARTWVGVGETRSRHLWPISALSGLVAAYVAVFGWLTWCQHSNSGTFGFDMGIHVQAI